MRNAEYARPRTTVVVPAFNEQAYIGSVTRQLAACRDHGHVDDVLIVDDGSTDATAAIARACGVEVVALGRNRGKASAVAAGARLCRDRGAQIMVILDADLADISGAQLDALVAPLVSSSELDMTVGTVQGDLTGISGQRAIRIRALEPLFNSAHSWCRKLFLTGYGLEVALQDLLPHQQVVHTEFAVARPAEAKQLGVRRQVDATNAYIHQRNGLATVLRRLRAGNAELPPEHRRQENRQRLQQVRHVEQRLFGIHAANGGTPQLAKVSQVDRALPGDLTPAGAGWAKPGPGGAHSDIATG
jgi:glycosyltransferase involved in cell wall biosynthesis